MQLDDRQKCKLTTCVFHNAPFAISAGKKFADAYITTIEEYKHKIDELYRIGGDQLLLQGGLNPILDLIFIVIFSGA